MSQTDWTNYDVDSVSVISGTEVTPQPAASINETQDIVAGALLTVDATSDVGTLTLKLPDSKGNHVSHMLKLAYDTEDPYTAAETYGLVRGVVYAVPESALSAATATAGQYLVADTDGKYAAKAAATDFVVWQVLTPGTKDNGGYFRVECVLSQIADS